VRGVTTISTIILFSLIIGVVAYAFFYATYLSNKIVLETKVPLETIQVIHKCIVEGCESGNGGSTLVIYVPSGSVIEFRDSRMIIYGIQRGLTENAVRALLESTNPYGAISITVVKSDTHVEISYTSHGRPVRFNHVKLIGGYIYSLTITCEDFNNVYVQASIGG